MTHFTWSKPAAECRHDCLAASGCCELWPLLRPPARGPKLRPWAPSLAAADAERGRSCASGDGTRRGGEKERRDSGVFPSATPRARRTRHHVARLHGALLSQGQCHGCGDGARQGWGPTARPGACCLWSALTRACSPWTALRPRQAVRCVEIRVSGALP